MSHPEGIDVVTYSLKPKPRKEYKSAMMLLIKHYEEKIIKFFKIADLDTLFCKYIHHEFGQPGQDVQVMSTELCPRYVFTY